MLATAALLFFAARVLLGVAKLTHDPFLSTFYLGAFLWLLAQIFGNLAAVWLIPSSFVARFLWITLGIAVAIQKLSADETNDRQMAHRAPQLVPA